MQSESTQVYDSPAPIDHPDARAVLSRADRFRARSREGGHGTVGPKCQLLTDIVAKVFSGWRTKILRAADASSERRREGPHRFIQNRSRTSVVALESHTAAEKSKDQLWRDFRGCSIFDFCNNIGTKRT